MAAPQRVLVVDDEPVVIASCRRILTSAGKIVETADCGRKGLEMALAHPYDLVVTDLKMPDMDGMDLVRALAKEQPETSVMIITGYGTIPSAVSAMKLGVHDYVEKPFTPDELVGAIDRVLAARHVRPEIEAETIRSVLKFAAQRARLGQPMPSLDTPVLAGFPLTTRAKEAILSGDAEWLEKRCGELPPDQREWLDQQAKTRVWSSH